MKQKFVFKNVSRRHALGLIGGTIAMSSIAMPVLADAASVAAKGEQPDRRCIHH